MAFNTIPTEYHKTALSGLQGALGNLREAVVSNFGFTDSDKLLFQIDDAMSWECIRDLDQMKEIFVLLLSISSQTNAPKEVIEWVEVVRADIAKILVAIANGEKL
jgi:hypothetical protein